MADEKRVVAIPTPESDKLSAALSEFRRKLPEMIEHHRLIAKLQRAAFDHYVAEGFTEAQALELAKSIR